MKLTNRLVAWLPQIEGRLWILMFGRLLLQIGTGFVLFYAAVFFVNEVGLSPAQVGFGIGSESISGVVGRVLGGSLADDPRWGRRKILLIAAAVSVLADLVLLFSNSFPTFLLGNLLMGLGIGLYWPATEAVVADLTQADNRNEAFALNRLCDNVGLGLGIVLGGLLVAVTGSYRAMYAIDGISFLVFFGVIYRAIPETLNPAQQQGNLLKGWGLALRDRALLIFAVANILFTTYLSLLNTALPLYLTRFVSAEPELTFPPARLSLLFAWYIGLCILTQIPMVRALRRLRHTQALMLSALSWALGFGLIWLTGSASNAHLLWAGLALTVAALATVAYTPSASALVIDLAPESRRGIYLSINSLCWAVGYFIGPTAGGWAMGESRGVADGFWVGAALSVGLVLLILQVLQRELWRLGQRV
ncbi:MAG: MFS transporter [Pegethrix bostrychoides GSE-TBD4-15B]|jgi:MFS family permease|uniref:MFS transporter n=1 Tax=Pegethrix bostrychoides GSE-TBD4-15B TaxID=2839662 RepID=A0A951PA81_9CYAN|nr:MFS transporter [Pegethrix bostrychoides GSE-TBD4-15B]